MYWLGIAGLILGAVVVGLGVLNPVDPAARDFVGREFVRRWRTVFIVIGFIFVVLGIATLLA
jgi:hypothetical protein